MDKVPKVSLIIPFYNDQDRVLDRLESAFGYLQSQGYSFEIILVDDGSREDRTGEIQAKFPLAKIIRYEKNRGKGYAVREGMKSARGDFCFYTDSELPFGLTPLKDALYHLEVREFDLVIGDRNLPESDYHVHMSFLRKVLSKIFTSIISRIVVTGVKDTQCGFKGFRRPIAQALFERARLNGFSFDVELIYIAFKHNFELKRIPVRLECHRDSTLRLHWDSWKMLWDVFRIKWNHLHGYYL